MTREEAIAAARRAGATGSDEVLGALYTEGENAEAAHTVKHLEAALVQATGTRRTNLTEIKTRIEADLASDSRVTGFTTGR